MQTENHKENHEKFIKSAYNKILTACLEDEAIKTLKTF